MKLKESFRNKTFQVGAYSVLTVLAIIVVAIVINVLVGHLPASIAHIDLTEVGIYTLTDTTVEKLESLEDEVEIVVVAQSGTEDDRIMELLARYQEVSDKISVSTVDPVVNPNFTSAYTNGSVSNSSLIVISGNKDYYLDFYSIYLYDYSIFNVTGDQADIYSEFDGENALTGAIDYVTNDNLPKVYVMSGHGEGEIPAEFERSAVAENFEILPFSFLTDTEIPADCSAMLIYAPSSDLSVEEADQLKSYVDAGGSLFLITKYSTLEKPNLLSVMEHYGVTAAEGLIMDMDKNYNVQSYYHYLLPEIKSHVITDPLLENGYRVTLPMSEGILMLPEVREKLTILPLLSTSTSAYGKVAGYQFQTFDWEPGDVYGPFYIGVAITQNTFSENPSHIAWVSSSFLLDNDANDVVSGGNMDLFLNTLGWMCGQESSITIHSKTLTPDYLTIPSSHVLIWTVIIIGVIPALFLIGGLAIMIYRRRR